MNASIVMAEILTIDGEFIVCVAIIFINWRWTHLF